MIKEHLEKAKDSALLAVEIYNKPRTSFKTGGYISLMVVAWTSLFHAYFLKNKIKPFYRTGKGKKTRIVKIEETLPNGKKEKQNKYWDISECIKQYWKDKTDAVRANLELIVSLRNMIVHRHLPEIDATLYGECQALIDNFNNFLFYNFGEKHVINEMLNFSLQFLPSEKQTKPNRNAKEVLQYVKKYRESLSNDIYTDPHFSFKAVLIKVSNHESKDALPIKFINEKDLTEEQRSSLNNVGIVLIKEKEIKVSEDEKLKEYTLTYKELTNELKKRYSNSFKENKYYHNAKKEIIEKRPDLIYKRKLDPNNSKSVHKNYYHPNILNEFAKYYYNKITN